MAITRNKKKIGVRSLIPGSWPLVPVLALSLLCAVRIASSQGSNLRGSIAPRQTPVPVSEQLEQERLAALPALKAQLEEKRLRERADLIVILDENFFNKMLAELAGAKFNAGGLFSVMIQNPRITLKNGLALARMEAQLVPTNQLLNITSTLQVTARLLVEQGPRDALVAKLQVVDLQPSGDQPAAQTALSPEQLSSILPPFTLPLEFDFDHTIQPGTVKQSKPIAFEVSPEPRRFRGHFEVTELLPLDGRLVVLARARNLSVR